MTYLMTTQTNGTLDDFRKVNALIGDEPPAGLLANYAGESDGGLVITSIWASKADSDRFTAERLVPALRQHFGPDAVSGPPSTMIDFVVVDEMIPERA